MTIKLLMSGGLDSFVAGLYMKSERNVKAVFIDWGQPTVSQEKASARYCSHHLEFPFEIVKIDLCTKNMEIGVNRPGPRVVPGRNKAFIEAIIDDDTSAVVIGCTKDDFQSYVDCRREYFDTLESELRIKILTPLIYKTKSEIVGVGKYMPLHLTWSCYQSEIAHPCGKCSSCNERNFAMSHVRL